MSMLGPVATLVAGTVVAGTVVGLALAAPPGP
jgi:hypothetical protein